MARLQQLVGAGRHETLVFGDGLNDIELMACADFSFAMRNGHDGPRMPPISSPARTMKLRHAHHLATARTAEAGGVRRAGR
ncbi:HAD hydrolase family protein [Aeromonas caviae]